MPNVCTMATKRPPRLASGRVVPSKGQVVHKSAKTGQFVSTKTAKRRPATTYATQLKPRAPKPAPKTAKDRK